MRSALAGWAAVLVTVSVYDAWALSSGAETLSTGYRAAYRAHPFIVGAATAFLVGHLTGHLPARYDPLRSTTREGEL